MTVFSTFCEEVTNGFWSTESEEREIVSEDGCFEEVCYKEKEKKWDHS